MDAVIEIVDVSWKREHKEILSGVNWRVDQGQHWAILGLNGSGKTTLLNILNGYIWPTKGTVSVLGERYGNVDLRELRKKIGWVSSSLQEKLYVRDLTQDVVISGKFASIGLYDTPTDEDRERAIELMKQLGCEHLIGRPYNTCSQGEKQKTLIARALMASPELLILDEASNGLDFLSRENLLSSINQLAEQPNAPTMLYVTHHIEEILPVFSHTLFIRRGEVMMQGKTSDLLHSNPLSDFFETPVHVDWHQDRAWLSVR